MLLRKKKASLSAVLLSCNISLLSWNKPRKGHLNHVKPNQLPVVVDGNKPFVQKEQFIDKDFVQNSSPSSDDSKSFPDFEEYLDRPIENDYLNDSMQNNAVIVSGLNNNCTLSKSDSPNDSYLHRDKICTQNVQK